MYLEEVGCQGSYHEGPRALPLLSILGLLAPSVPAQWLGTVDGFRTHWALIPVKRYLWGVLMP